MQISDNIKRVCEEIEYYSKKAWGSEDAVDLIAVSKTVAADKIEQAYNAGLRMFGENKVQEYVKKSENLAKDIKWNIIGQLQTNKVKYIIEKNIYLLHSLDRLSLAEELQRQCKKYNKTINALVQVNISGEQTKAGVSPEEVEAFFEELSCFDSIKIKGIMTIGPNTDDEVSIRNSFARTKVIYDKMAGQIEGMEYLSMGMSHDFAWAIQEGSNMVRVGSAIFGERVIH